MPAVTVIGHRAANCGSALESCLVATVTIRRIESVVVVYMAGCAGRRSRGHVCSRQGKPGRAVVNPAVVQLTVVWQEEQFATAKDGRCRVNGIVRLLDPEVSTISRRNRQIVIVVDVTQSAGHIRVPIGEQEPRRAVVECCCRPTHCRVAGRAIHKRKRRPGCWMDRVLGLLPGRQMASRIAAIGRGDHQIIVIVNMTKGAGHIRMAIGQQETGRAVVELGVQPTVERMAGIAGCRELCGNVIGIGGFLKIRQVAGRAGGRKTR